MWWPPATRLVIEHLFYFLGVVLSVFIILVLIFRKKAKPLGVLLAGGAGTLGGVLIFREPLHPLQWGGVVLILGGVAVLSFGKGDPASAASGAPSRRVGESVSGSGDSPVH